MLDFKLGTGTVVHKGIDVEIINLISANDFNYLFSLIKEGMNKKEGLGVLEELGRGAFGTVYGYKDYAIKFIRNSTSKDSYRDLYDGRESKDADILKSLQHLSTVPKIYAVVDNRAIIMSRVRGVTVGTFKHRLKNKQIDNFISPAFNLIFEETLKDILHAGFAPIDVHDGNVMVDEYTGNPVIVDVGLFRELDEYDLERAKNRESIDLTRFHSSSYALRWVCHSMNQYIEEKSQEKAKKVLDVHMPNMLEALV